MKVKTPKPSTVGEKIPRWIVHYRCGCTDEVSSWRRDLLDYCGQHGHDMQEIIRLDTRLTIWRKPR